MAKAYEDYFFFNFKSMESMLVFKELEEIPWEQEKS